MDNRLITQNKKWQLTNSYQQLLLKTTSTVTLTDHETCASKSSKKQMHQSTIKHRLRRLSTHSFLQLWGELNLFLPRRASPTWRRPNAVHPLRQLSTHTPPRTRFPLKRNNEKRKHRTETVNCTRVVYLAVLPVPNRDSIWIIGCHHPWMRRMQLDLNDFIARRPKRFQAKHLLLIRKLIRVQKLATTKKNGFRKLSRSKSRFRFSSNLSRIWTPCRFQECEFIERTELKNAPLVSNCAFQATKQGISKTSPCMKW